MPHPLTSYWPQVCENTCARKKNCPHSCHEGINMFNAKKDFFDHDSQWHVAPFCCPKWTVEGLHLFALQHGLHWLDPEEDTWFGEYSTEIIKTMNSFLCEENEFICTLNFTCSQYKERNGFLKKCMYLMLSLFLVQVSTWAAVETFYDLFGQPDKSELQ